MSLILALLATLSIWEYPARYPEHVRLRNQFVAALREGDTATMEETCRKGVKLLPDDPTWHYNLACSLAYFAKREKESFDELETAIDLGFRDADAIAKDSDLRRLAQHDRYAELIEYAKSMALRPLMTGPLANVEATGIFGRQIALGEQNFGWDFDLGCFVAQLKLAPASAGGNVGDLYMNRDGGHSQLNVAAYPGLTVVKLDQSGRERGLDRAVPNILFPYPVFGNSSLAYTQPKFWRSLPRALVTTELSRLNAMLRLYLSNQVWVFPSNADTAPVGTNGDVFASITPYWLTTAGRSFSDQPYLRAALEVSRSLPAETKREAVRQGLLAPTVQTLIRKTLRGVANEADYLSARAHPTALPPGGVDTNRLVAAAAQLSAKAIPPLAVIRVTTPEVPSSSPWPELSYTTPFAWAYVLRAEVEEREFVISASGAAEFEFAHTHGENALVKLERLTPNSARVTLRRSGLNPTNRVDIAVFGRNPGTGWGAPSYVSFARMDPTAAYSDPVLSPLGPPEGK